MNTETTTSAPDPPSATAANDITPRRTETQPEPALAPRTAGGCARCGKPFRGDWDSHKTAQGVLCHVCANQAYGSVKVEQGPGYVKPLYLDPTLTEPVRAPAKTGRIQEFVNSHYTAVSLCALAVGILMIVIAAFSSDIAPAPEVASTGAGRRVPYLPFIFWGVWVATSILPTLLSMYYTLASAKRLPNDAFIGNVVYLLPAAVLMTLLGGFPCIGFLLAMFYFWSHFDIDFPDLATYVVAYIGMGAVTWTIQMLVFGLIGLALF